MQIGTLMEGYFEKDKPRNNLLREALPAPVPIVVPSEKSWEMLEKPEALQRLFKFSDQQPLLYFLEDIIQLQNQIGHHARILIDHNQVLIQVSTKVLDRVTDLDVEYAKKVDLIYDDIITK